MILTGGCRCGSIRFEITDVLDAGYCHCRHCRRRSGAPVFAFLTVQEKNLRLLSGALLPEPSETTGTRQHCAQCRGEIMLNYESREFGSLHAIGIGLLDAPAAIRPTYHQFAADMLPWLDINDSLPRFVGNDISHPRDRMSPYQE